MTDRTSATVASLAAGTGPAIIAAHRYLAFLDLERRWLIHELFPDRKPDEMVFVPCDSQVDRLCCDSSPLDRAIPVLAALGIDPHADDYWVSTVGKVSMVKRQLKRPPRR